MHLSLEIKSQKLEFQLKPCFTVSAQYRHCVHKIKKKATFCTEQRSRGPMVWWYIAAMHCRLHTGKAAAVCKIIKKVRSYRLSCKMYCRLLQNAAFFLSYTTFCSDSWKANPLQIQRAYHCMLWWMSKSYCWNYKE